MTAAYDPALKNSDSKTEQKTVTITNVQAQEILDFLGQCPAGRVYQLIGYLLAAGVQDE